ncbi:CotH kinase family protein, partial [bacterium]|nr:CotH kinase family protein [bacterium]
MTFSFIKFMIILFTPFFAASLSAQSLILNELMSKNTKVLPDENGKYFDWVEILNIGSEAAPLEGYTLSDRENPPGKWRFPAFILEPGCFCVVHASGQEERENVYYRTLIDHGDTCKYHVGNSAILSTWRSMGFNDSEWPSGPSGFGYGDGDDSTVVQRCRSLFIRKVFRITGRDSIFRAVLHVDVDDGFAAYLNGIEIARKNLGPPGKKPYYYQLADSTAEAVIYRGGRPEAFEIGNLGVFREGKNILAIEVHNDDAKSPDLTLIPYLTIGKTSDDAGADCPDHLSLFIPPFKANFKLSAGERLFLREPAGSMIDSVSIPEIPVDYSLGRLPDGGSWNILTLPTPGEKNSDIVFAGAGPPVLLEPEGGFYGTEQVVVLSTGLPDAVVRYTLDGSDPDWTSKQAVQPVLIRSTQTLRARSYVPGLEPGPVMTGSYLIREHRSLPVICLSTDPRNLFDWAYGLFEMGPDASPENPHYGANFWQDWERPVHIEFFEPGGTPGFRMDLGMKVYGGWSRAHAQKSVALYARGEYGKGEIEYRLFPDKTVDHFESFILRNSGNDWYNTLFRDGLMQDLVKDVTQIETMAFRPAVVFINGEYWGILNLREKISEHFIAANWNLDADEIDLLSTEGSATPAVITGSRSHYTSFMTELSKTDMTVKDNYLLLDRNIDVGAFIDYQAAEIYFDNTDWPGNNIKFWRPQMPGGKWRWILFDTDFGFGLYSGGSSQNTLEFATAENGPSWPNPPYSTLLLRKGLDNPVFRNRFISRFSDLLNTAFESGRVLFWIDSLAVLIADEIPEHLHRWENQSVESWEYQVDRLRDFAERRPASVRDHIAKKFKLTRRFTVSLDVPEPGGRVRINSLLISGYPWTGIYFKDIPVSLTAVPDPGYAFAGWSDTALGNTVTVDIPLARNLNLQAFFQPADPNPASVVINEINYRSADDFDPGDWIELANRSDVTIPMGGWKFTDGEASHAFILPAGCSLAARGFLILCEDTARFRLLYPDAGGYLGNFDFGLSRTGDC